MSLDLGEVFCAAVLILLALAQDKRRVPSCSVTSEAKCGGCTAEGEGTLISEAA